MCQHRANTMSFENNRSLEAPGHMAESPREGWAILDARWRVRTRRRYDAEWLMGAGLLLKEMYARASDAERKNLRSKVDDLIASKVARQSIFGMFADIERHGGSTAVWRRMYTDKWLRAAGRHMEAMYTNGSIEERLQILSYAKNHSMDKTHRRALLGMFTDLDVCSTEQCSARKCLEQQEQAEISISDIEDVGAVQANSMRPKFARHLNEVLILFRRWQLRSFVSCRSYRSRL